MVKIKMAGNLKKNIVIVHYNTPYLTECLVRSINLFVKNATIYIFDNSDKKPFTANFSNVKILDNTKGDIINFNEWLKKFPDKEKTSASKNNYGSAKHCLSIQKCIELLNENFLLLDSDILLKKNIDELFDKKYIFIGGTEIWKARASNATPKTRAIPYLCYINVELCKKNGIKYFDSNHIFGLSKQGDNYDTGTFFYEQINKKRLKWKKINLSDYIVHYKGASWVDEAKIYDNYKQIDVSEWITKNKKYWFKEEKNNENVVYTCITGGYDGLIEPKYITNGFDYICFTDNPNLKSNIWKIKPLPKETDGLSQVKKQRYVKINPHKLFPNYKLSIWVDGNVILKGNLNEFVKKNLEKDIDIYVPQHPQRNCIYSEAREVLRVKKDKEDVVNSQINEYKKECFPKNYGLLQSNILLRKHNNPDCIKLMENWFEELKNKSHRDQLSFNYVCWKNKDVKVKYLDKKIYDSSWFKWKAFHHKVRISKTIIEKTENIVKEKKSKIKTKLITQDIGLY